jgi:hypothetical protein
VLNEAMDSVVDPSRGPARVEARGSLVEGGVGRSSDLIGWVEDAASAETPGVRWLSSH